MVASFNIFGKLSDNLLFVWIDYITDIIIPNILFMYILNHHLQWFERKWIIENLHITIMLKLVKALNDH